MNTKQKPIPSPSDEIVQTNEVGQPKNKERFTPPNHDASKLEIPSVLADKYEYLQHIGSGSQGDIYKARVLKTGKLVAIKQLRIDQVDNWKAYDLFEREAEVLSKLNIPGVSKFYEAFKYFDADPPCAFIVQKFIDGVSLETHIRSGLRWTLPRTFGIALQILDILEKLHKNDPPIIHRDLKPGNIMITREKGKDRVYLIDFGAVANPIVQGGGSTIAGTFGYMPPEQLMGKPGPESDLYALAATIVYMLSGVSPADIQTLEFRLVIEPHLQSFPTVVMHLLGRMLEPSAQKRLTDYDEIRRYFNNFIQSDFTEGKQTDDEFYASPDYVAQFKSVKTLWDSGNLKLWSALPAATDRLIPNEIESMEAADLLSHRSIMRGEYKPKVKTSFLIKLLTLTFVGWVGYFALGYLFDVRTLAEALNSGSTGILAWIIFAIFICIIIVGFIWLAFGAGQWRSSKALPVHKITPYGYILCKRKLLANGQKTIATILSVQYIPNTDPPVELYAIIGHESKEYIHNIPSFRISYKFNPPDDSLKDDLVHQITIHRDPGSHLQPGDPLPILYWIAPLNNNKVISMPYPFAQCDTENYKDIICYTKDGAITDYEAALFY